MIRKKLLRLHAQSWSCKIEGEPKIKNYFIYNHFDVYDCAGVENSFIAINAGERSHTDEVLKFPRNKSKMKRIKNEDNLELGASIMKNFEDNFVLMKLLSENVNEGHDVECMS